MADRSVLYTDTLQTFWETYNLTAQDVGDISLLRTVATDLTDAINEVHDERDALDTRVGELSSIAAAVRGSDVTSSVDLVYDDYFAFSGRNLSYNTTATTLLGAINEVHDERDALDVRVGVISTINVAIRGGDVVTSIDNFYDDYIAWAAPAVAFDTTAQTATGALNELHSEYDGLNAWVGTRSFTFTGGVIVATNVTDAVTNVWNDYYSFLGRGTTFDTAATNVVGAINELESNHNTLDSRVGSLTGIAVAVRGSDVTSSIDNVYDEFNARVGSLGNLDVAFTGTNDDSVIDAINFLWAEHDDIDSRVGPLSNLGLDFAGNNSDVTTALDWVYSGSLARDGNLASLTTTAKGNLVAAINEVQAEVESNDTDITAINNALGTVAAINDAIEGATFAASINNFYTAYASRTDVGTTLLTTAQTLGDAINEIHGAAATTEVQKDAATLSALDARVGNLSNLDVDFTGVNDDSIVAAINWVYGLQTGENQVFTNASVTGTLDVGGGATFDSTLNVSGAFTSVGIDDNATANRVAIENNSITLKTATTVQGALTSTGNITGTNLILGANSSMQNGAGELVELDNTTSNINLVTNATTRAQFGSTISLLQNTSVTGTLAVSGAATVQGGTVWHSGNDGPGSGLNADLLDGVQLTNIARTDIAEVFNSNVTVQGNLTVNGTTTTINTTNLTVSDNIIVLNNDVTGTPTENAGVEVERGTAANVAVRWNETSDVWELTQNGTNYYRILTVNDEGAGNNLDADTLDGQHGSYYLNYNNFTNRPTIGNATVTVSAGTGLTGGGNFTTNQTGNETLTLNVSGLTVSEFNGSAIITSSEAFSNVNTALMTAAAIEDKILSYGYTTNVGDITGVTAGTGLSGGGASGTVALNVSGLTVSEFAGGAIQTNGEAFSYSNTVLMTAAAIEDRILSKGYTTNVGDITGVTAGTGLSGGGASGSVTLNVSGLTTAQFNGSAIQTSGEAFVDNDTTLMTAAAIEDRILSKGYTTNVGDITGVTAGTGLTGGGSSGSVTLNVSGLTTAQFAGSAIQTNGEAFSYSNSILMTAAAIEDRILSKGYTTNVGDITGVTAGSGLTGGGASGAVTLNIGAGTGISVAADSISVNMGAFSTTNLSEGSNLYYTTARVDAAIYSRVTTSYVNELHVNATSVDGLDSTQFLRSDAADAKTSGTLTFNDSVIAAFGSQNDFEVFHNGTHAYMDMNVGNLYVRDGTTTRFTFDDNGTFTATGDVTAFSDRRLKDFIEPIQSGLDIIRGIEPVYFRWNDKARERGIDSTREQVGVIAQDVEKVQPQAVYDNDDGDKLVAYEKLVPALIKAVQELEEKVEALEKLNKGL